MANKLSPTAQTELLRLFYMYALGLPALMCYDDYQIPAHLQNWYNVRQIPNAVYSDPAFCLKDFRQIPERLFQAKECANGFHVQLWWWARTNCADAYYTDAGKIIPRSPHTPKSWAFAEFIAHNMEEEKFFDAKTVTIKRDGTLLYDGRRDSGHVISMEAIIAVVDGMRENTHTR